MRTCARLRAGTSAELMAVVKGDGYGHGMVPAARAALDAGADRLGVCTLDEALTLRRAGITAPVLAWLLAPGLPLHEAVTADIDLGAAESRPARRDDRGEPRSGRPPGPAAPQDRHRAVPGRGDRRRLAGAGRGRREGRRPTA